MYFQLQGPCDSDLEEEEQSDYDEEIENAAVESTTTQDNKSNLQLPFLSHGDLFSLLMVSLVLYTPVLALKYLIFRDLLFGQDFISQHKEFVPHALIVTARGALIADVHKSSSQRLKIHN
ncbi:hypothetical protein RYX36_010335 [Vicia faba]